jgi:hypothetical protein
MMGWAKGRTVWLPMENIVTITEFDDLKEAKKAMESGAGNPFGGFGMSVPLEGPKTAPPGVKGELPPEKRP